MRSVLPFRVTVVTSFPEPTPVRTSVYEVDAVTAREAQVAALHFESRTQPHEDDETVCVTAAPTGHAAALRARP